MLARTLGVPLFQEQLLRIAMIAANFTGGEAEDLRRAMGFKRSQSRMKEIEARLRAGMTENGISSKAQEEIILSITSFALYGFPESHAASFALIAYASAFLKCHYLAAFTAALLNNQPMGFYSPATITQDAQRHGLKILPVDVMRSEWVCTLEAVPSLESRVPKEVDSTQYLVPSRNFCSPTNERKSGVMESRRLATRNSGFGTAPALRLGLRYVRGLREEAGLALVRARACAPFTSIQDFTRRVPELRKDELTTLAEIGALNAVEHEYPSTRVTRRLFISPARSSPVCEGVGMIRLLLATRNSVLGTRASPPRCPLAGGTSGAGIWAAAGKIARAGFAFAATAP